MEGLHDTRLGRVVTLPTRQRLESPALRTTMLRAVEAERDLLVWKRRAEEAEAEVARMNDAWDELLRAQAKVIADLKLKLHRLAWAVALLDANALAMATAATLADWASGRRRKVKRVGRRDPHLPHPAAVMVCCVVLFLGAVLVWGK